MQDKISKISEIKGCRTFRDYTWSDGLRGFERYNLVYGWNGTGKTTISDIFRAIELKTKGSLEGSFTVVAGEHSITSDALGTVGANIPSIRVFNRDYVQENIFSHDEKDITPIFYLGKESVEKRKEVEEKKGKLGEAKSDKTRSVDLKETKDKELDKLCTDKAKIIKEALRSSGKSNYNDYDKGKFKKKIKEISSGMDVSTPKRNDDQKAALKEQFDSKPKERIDVQDFTLPDLAVLRSEVDTLIQKSIVSETLSQLQDDAELSRWAKDGLDIHKQKKHKDCQFCLQPLPDRRLQDLERHFNDQYNKMIADIDSLCKKLGEKIESIKSFKFTHKAEVHDHLHQGYSDAKSAFEKVIGTYAHYLGALVSCLGQKKASPFSKISIAETLPADGQQSYQAYSKVLKDHNTFSENHAEEVAEARNEYEESIVAENLAEYNRIKKAASEADTKAKTSEDKITKLTQEIETLEKKIREHRKPAEELNADLKSYLGHDELQFETKENGYSIVRSGKSAKCLSEGEKTAIALLYFFKTLSGQGFKLAEGIVVIDDPVSSMDDGALFHAFGYIKAKTKEAHQLFILTHNFMFFRQVRDWFKRTKSSFYQTKCTLKYDKRYSEIVMLDKLLKDYESDYHYLFSLVGQASRSQDSSVDLGSYYHMPNVARRVLETFLTFKRPPPKHNSKGYISRVLKDIGCDPSILNFLHLYSHGDRFDNPQHDSSPLAATPEIMRNILELIKTVDKDHYDGMMQAIDGTMDQNVSDQTVAQTEPC